MMQWLVLDFTKKLNDEDQKMYIYLIGVDVFSQFLFVKVVESESAKEVCGSSSVLPSGFGVVFLNITALRLGGLFADFLDEIVFTHNVLVLFPLPLSPSLVNSFC